MKKAKPNPKANRSILLITYLIVGSQSRDKADVTPSTGSYSHTPAASGVAFQRGCAPGQWALHHDPLSCLTSEGSPHLLGKEGDRPISRGIHLNSLLDDKS